MSGCVLLLRKETGLLWFGDWNIHILINTPLHRRTGLHPACLSHLLCLFYSNPPSFDYNLALLLFSLPVAKKEEKRVLICICLVSSPYLFFYFIFLLFFQFNLSTCLICSGLIIITPVPYSILCSCSLSLLLCIVK